MYVKQVLGEIKYYYKKNHMIERENSKVKSYIYS